MLPDQSPSIAAVAAGLASETWRVRGEMLRQAGCIEYLIRIVVRYRHLGRGNQGKLALVLYMEKVLFEFRQLVGAEKGLSIYEERRQRLGITVFHGMNIALEVDQG